MNSSGLLTSETCGPSCCCQFCTNTNKSQTHTTTHTDLLVDELINDNSEEVYVDDSEDDLAEWQQEEMDHDEELHTLMDFVFGQESDEDC